MKKIILLTGIFVLLVGCQTQDIYYWGSYESQLYNMYNKPGKATPTVQIEQLTRDIQQANNKGKPVPPGLYAHLGFMYSIEGKTEKAFAAFNEEKQRFPESAALIDGMLERAKQHNTAK